MILGITESVTFWFSNAIEKYTQPSDEKLYYAGKIVGNIIVMI